MWDKRDGLGEDFPYPTSIIPQSAIRNLKPAIPHPSSDSLCPRRVERPKPAPYCFLEFNVVSLRRPEEPAAKPIVDFHQKRLTGPVILIEHQVDASQIDSGFSTEITDHFLGLS